MKVLVTERIAQDGIDILKQSFGEESVDTDFKLSSEFERLKSVIGKYDALVVRSTTPVNAELLEHAKNQI